MNKAVNMSIIIISVLIFLLVIAFGVKAIFFRSDNSSTPVEPTPTTEAINQNDPNKEKEEEPKECIMVGSECLKPICRRAKELHMEYCTHNEFYCIDEGFHYGDMIKYGKLGYKGTLSPGDAFDCDVNGDGIYDSEKERFYYLSDYWDTFTKTFDTSTAALVYYRNYKGGTAYSSADATYDSNRPYCNWKGPNVAIKDLPTANEWKNVSLKSSSRKIYSCDDQDCKEMKTSVYPMIEITPNPFSYAGYAARLLNIQEVFNGCNTGGTLKINRALYNCHFLLEQTKFTSKDIEQVGSWLENPTYDDTYFRSVLVVNSSVLGSGVRHHIDGSPRTGNINGTRPVIDVPKTRIDY